MIINGVGRPRKYLGVTISLPSFGLAWYHHLPGHGILAMGKSLKVPQTLIFATFEVGLLCTSQNYCEG